VTAAAELLASLRGGGFAVTARGDRLFVTPREKLTPAECERVAANKAGLMDLLAAERWAACGTCRAGVDPACGEDVWRLCGRAGCPYRPPRRRS
jgi:hypothetical protein